MKYCLHLWQLLGNLTFLFLCVRVVKPLFLAFNIFTTFQLWHFEILVRFRISLLLSSALVFSYSLSSWNRIVISSIEDRKKQRSSKLLSRLKSRKDTANVQSQPLERHLQLLNTIRVQMQVTIIFSSSLLSCTFMCSVKSVRL